MSTLVCIALLVLVLFDQVRISELRQRLISLEDNRVPWLERSVIQVGSVLEEHARDIHQLQQGPACRGKIS